MQGGFFAYWWRVTTRSANDAWKVSNDVGVGPVKLSVGFALTLLACVFGFSFLGETVSERILWALGGLVAGLGGFLFVFTFFLVRTPWKMENEIVASMDAKREADSKASDAKGNELIAKINALGDAIKETENQRANLAVENKRIASLDIHGNLLRSQINKFARQYEGALSLLRDFKETGAYELAQIDQDLSEYLPQRIPQYHGLFSECEQYGRYFTFDEDDPDPKLKAPEGERCIKTCNDRLEKLAEILSVIS